VINKINVYKIKNIFTNNSPAPKNKKSKTKFEIEHWKT